MARTNANKLLMTIPRFYRGDFMSCLDRTTPAGQAMHDRYGMVIADLGGEEATATTKRSTARDWAALDVLVESLCCKLAAGEEVDVGALTQLMNSKLGITRQLGLERRAKSVRTLAQVMRGDPVPTAPRAPGAAIATDTVPGNGVGA